MIIYIDMPLDIALARRIVRDYKDTCNNGIINDMSFYLKESRICFTDYKEKMKSCDLIIDGSLTLVEITDIIRKKIIVRLN